MENLNARATRRCRKYCLLTALLDISEEQFKELGVLKIGQREELRQRAASSDSLRDNRRSTWKG
jgi:hypothetical protein